MAVFPPGCRRLCPASAELGEKTPVPTLGLPGQGRPGPCGPECRWEGVGWRVGSGPGEAEERLLQQVRGWLHGGQCTLGVL